VNNEEWGTLNLALNSILGTPNNLKDNLRNTAGCLEDDRTYDKAMALEKEIMEYIKQVNFKEYFDNLTTPTGRQALEFQQFSLQSLQAANKKLDQFIALMPSDQVARAKSQLSNV